MFKKNLFHAVRQPLYSGFHQSVLAARSLKRRAKATTYNTFSFTYRCFLRYLLIHKGVWRWKIAITQKMRYNCRSVFRPSIGRSPISFLFEVFPDTQRCLAMDNSHHTKWDATVGRSLGRQLGEARYLFVWSTCWYAKALGDGWTLLMNLACRQIRPTITWNECYCVATLHFPCSSSQRHKALKRKNPCWR